MRKCTLHFNTIQDLCSFIKDAHLRNFLLLGKKSILIASMTDGAINLAKQTYKATTVETAEVFQVARCYFGETA
jgi:hypothetical protein